MGPQAQALLAAVPDDIEVSQVGSAPDTIKSPHAGKAGAIEPQREKRAKRGPARLHQESTPASSRGASNQMPGPQVSTTRQAKETLSHGVLAHLHGGFLPSSQDGESKREPFKGLSLDCHSFEGLLEVGLFSKLDILGDYFSGAGFKSYACPMWGSSPLLLGELLRGETLPVLSSLPPVQPSLRREWG